MQADCPGGSLTKEDCGILLSKATPHTLHMLDREVPV